MPRTKLTDAAVAAAVLPPGKAEVVLWDSEVTGFGLRIRPGGRTWIVAYRPAGSGRSANTRRLKLGTPETVATAAAARKLARIALGKIAAGGDPLAESRELRRRKQSHVTELLDRYDEDLQRRGYVNRTVVISGLRKRLKAFPRHGHRQRIWRRPCAHRRGVDAFRESRRSGGLPVALSSVSYVVC